MLRANEGVRSPQQQQASTRHGTLSSFDLWLERTQRKGAAGHVDPHDAVRSPSSQLPQRQMLSSSSARTSPVPQLQSRLEQLEGLIFTQGHFNRLHNTVSEGTCNDTDIYPTTYASAEQPYAALPPTQRPLYFSRGDGDYGSAATRSGLGIDSFLYNGNGGGGAVGLSSLNAPYAMGREPFGSYATLPAESEAERYIARLEEEVQTLLIESGEKDRLVASATQTRDVVALQLQEAQRRSEVEREAQSAAQTLVHTFLRRASLLQVVGERSRAIELQTEISLLKHEVRMAEAMRQQAERTATAAAAAQEVQRRREEEQLSKAVTATVSSLLQQEYARLAELVTTPPQKARDGEGGEGRVGPEKQQPGSAAGAPSGTSTAELAEEQRRLHALLQDAFAALVKQQSSAAPANKIEEEKGAPGTHRASAAVEAGQSARGLSLADSAHLLRLVSRVVAHQEALLDMYCSTVEAKSSQAQYETNLVRLIHEKQSALTWATLYEEKKDEVRHLNEKLMELRGELRLAATGTATTTGMTPRGGNGAGSLAASFSSQSYEAFAAPFVPQKKKGHGAVTPSAAAAAPSPTLKAESRHAGGDGVQASASAAAQRRPLPNTKPIAELREEARRLGAHPAVHYPPPVTSPSPSMPSLHVSHTPLEVEQTVLKLQSHRPSIVSRRDTATDASSPSMPSPRSPGVALIRSFAPRNGSSGSSSSSSSASSLSASDHSRRHREAKKKGSAGQSQEPKASGSSHAVPTHHSSPAGASVRRRPSTSSSSSSASLADAAASRDKTPVPASRGAARINMPVLQRATTAASSSTSLSSLGSARSASETKPTLGAHGYSPSPTPAKAERLAAKPQAVHNSFDDDEDDNDAHKNRKGSSNGKDQRSPFFTKATGAATASKAASSRPADKTATTVSATAAGKGGLASASARTESPTAAARTKGPAVEVKRLSLHETVKAMERAARAVDDDGDTSSLSLTSASSLSVAPRPLAKGGAQPQPQKSSITKLSPAKAQHPRKSSFDSDDDAEAPAAAARSSRGAARKAASSSSDDDDDSAALVSVPVVKAVPAAAVTKSIAPDLSAAVSGSAASKKPQKLKLPSW